MKQMIVAVLVLNISLLFSQNVDFTKEKTFKVGHLLDSTFKKGNIHTEFSFGKANGLFGITPGGYNDRSIVMNLETSFKVGFFPIKKLLIGWEFSPYITFSDKGAEGFRWSTGPFIRYYFPFYRIDRNNQLKSPVALYVFFNYYFGQYNPIVLDRPFDTRFTTGFSLGIGFSFKLKKNLLLNFEFGPRYDFFAKEFTNYKFTTLFKIGLSYSFPSKQAIAEKKYKRLNN